MAYLSLGKRLVLPLLTGESRELSFDGALHLTRMRARDGVSEGGKHRESEEIESRRIQGGARRDRRGS